MTTQTNGLWFYVHIIWLLTNIIRDGEYYNNYEFARIEMIMKLRCIVLRKNNRIVFLSKKKKDEPEI